MDELNIEYHYQRTRHLFAGERPEQEVLRDLHLHALTVIQAAQDEMIRCVQAEQGVGSPEAREYLRFGVGRRLSILVHSLRSLLRIVPPGREQPIRGDEGAAVTRDLNVVYINVVGVLDNLAWASLHEKASGVLAAIRPTEVGLFTRWFGKRPELQELTDRLEEYREWFTDLRSRRDPAAHRIPLYLPPALLNQEQVAEHERLGQGANEAIRRQDWGGWQEIMDRQQQIGRLYHVFLTAPGAPMYHFYPTIPEDVGQMVKIIRVAMEFVSEAHHDG